MTRKRLSTITTSESADLINRYRLRKTSAAEDKLFKAGRKKGMWDF